MFNIKEYGIIVLLAWLSFGAACCCKCVENTRLGTATLRIDFGVALMNYPPERTRNCPIPVPAGDICTVTGDFIRKAEFDYPDDDCTIGFLAPGKYVLWAEYESCCDFRLDPIIEACATDCTCVVFPTENTANSTWVYRFALNTAAADCSPVIPAPIENNLNIKVYYMEPCFNSSMMCDSPFPCNYGTYRNKFKGNMLAQFDNDGNSIVSIPLTYDKTYCNILSFCGP